MRNSHNNHMGKRVGAAVALAATLLMTTACGTESASSGPEGSVNVVVSINQWESLASQIGGNKVKVASILSNQNVEAHDFEPQPSDIAKISEAQIVLVNGADYDSWATKATKNTQAVVVNAAQEGGVKAGGNPHVWFSAAVRTATAKAYAAALSKIDAKDSAYFTSQLTAWSKKESDLEASLTEAKKKTDGTAYAATESVAHYLAQDLGMKDVTPTGYAQAVENESEPAPGDIKKFQEALADGSIKVLIVNDQETNSTTDMIVKAAKKANVRIVHLTESMPSTYTDLVTWVESLVKKF